MNPMTKRQIRKTATHEAGHFVARWYLGFPPARVEIYTDGPHGWALGRAYPSRAKGFRARKVSSAAFFCAGIAAETIPSRLSAVASILYLCKVDALTIEAGPDKSEDLTSTYMLPGAGEDAKNWIKYFFALVPYVLLKRNWSKVEQVREALLAKGKITTEEAKRLYSSWGCSKPIDFTGQAMKLIGNPPPPGIIGRLFEF